MLATIAAQDLIKVSENTKAVLTKKAAGVQLDAPTKSADGAIAKALKMSPSTVTKYLKT